MSQLSWMLKPVLLSLPLMLLAYLEEVFLLDLLQKIATMAWLLWISSKLLDILINSWDPSHVMDGEQVKNFISWYLIGGLLVLFVLGARLDPFLMVVQGSTFVVALLLVKTTKLHRNRCQKSRLEQEHKLDMGLTLARTNFSFLENVITGGKNGSTFLQLLQQHLKKERIEGGCYTRLVIPFPEWTNLDSSQARKQQVFGSVGDLLQKEKDEGADHTLVHEKITYTFLASGGRHRTCQLEVLKSRHEQGATDYLAISENRALNTLYQMVSEHCIDFSPENFGVQFHIYRRELGRLLDAHEGCKGRYVLMHYKEEKGGFTKAVNRLLDSRNILTSPRQ